MVEILQLVHEISSFPEVLYKSSVLKKLLKIHRQTQEAVIRRCSVKRKNVLKNFAKSTGKHLFRSHFFKKVADCNPETVRSSHWRFSVKRVVRKNFANFTEKNTCVGVSF